MRRDNQTIELRRNTIIELETHFGVCACVRVRRACKRVREFDFIASWLGSRIFLSFLWSRLNGFMVWCTSMFLMAPADQMRKSKYAKYPTSEYLFHAMAILQRLRHKLPRAAARHAAIPTCLIGHHFFLSLSISLSPSSVNTEQLTLFHLSIDEWLWKRFAANNRNGFAFENCDS